MWHERWLHLALLSAACGSVIPILAKVGLKGVDSDAATILRSVAMTVSLLIAGTFLGVWGKIHTLREAGAKPIVFIMLTGIAGAASWLFYFKALKLADATKVAPVDKLGVPMAIILAFLVLGERPSAWNWLGIAMVCIGAYLAAMGSKG